MPKSRWHNAMRSHCKPLPVTLDIGPQVRRVPEGSGTPVHHSRRISRQNPLGLFHLLLTVIAAIPLRRPGDCLTAFEVTKKPEKQIICAGVGPSKERASCLVVSDWKPLYADQVPGIELGRHPMYTGSIFFPPFQDGEAVTADAARAIVHRRGWHRLRQERCVPRRPEEHPWMQDLSGQQQPDSPCDLAGDIRGARHRQRGVP